MEYKKIEEINKKLKTIDIKGKDYIEVNQRILAFRELYPDGAIITEIVSMENGVVTMKATCLDNGVVIATGHAQEKESSSFINKTSYIENCETSAVGRALGILGIGATNSIASAEEVLNAINNQNKKENTILENTLNSGKFVGKKWIEVCQEDMSYIELLIAKGNSTARKVKEEYYKRFPDAPKFIEVEE